MQYTVKDLLTNPLLNSANLLAAETIISSQPIESVTVMEMPVEDFVYHNELVLTTAIGCGNNPDLFLSYVEAVFSAGAAAMAISTGRHVLDIPEQIISFCQNENFPLIELPWELRFGDIIKITLEQINQWEQNSQAKADIIQRKLLRLYMENKSLNDALSYLSKNLKMTVTVENDDKNTWIDPTLNDSDTLLTTYHQKEPYIIHSKNHGFTQIVPIHMPAHESYRLLLESKSPNATPIPWLILKQAVTILSLWILQQETKINREEKEKEEFMQILLNGDWSTDGKEDFIKQGEKLNYEVELPYVCIVGYPENLMEFYQIPNSDSIGKIENTFKKSVSTILESAAKSLKKKMIYTFHRNFVIVFIECTEEKASEDAHLFLDKIDLSVEKGKIPAFSLGIGENQAGKFTFHLSYQNARTALEIGRTHKGPGQRFTYANTGIYQLLSALMNNPSASEIMHSTIGNIAAYDKNKGLDLLHTLATYIHHQKNVSQTARTLSLHRQSLLYRLRKIEKLTDRSLDNPDDVFLLDLCLRLWGVRFERR
ncbi:PucR family transcriptional regulator [Oceanobacillus damuensis]|uniref:PucR family transcriptional regulator n=1 Tax=Oceanobacillus damuensis TaxID=937928 RepID=UPI00082A5C5C|nr:PucR family transcriptional regulator [Oceanobacillus damuensis]